jgi:hypothetical protein
MTSEPIVQLDNLRRSFTVRQKVETAASADTGGARRRRISASIEPGGGWLHRTNGAKSATIKMLTSILVLSGQVQPAATTRCRTVVAGCEVRSSSGNGVNCGGICAARHVFVFWARSTGYRLGGHSQTEGWWTASTPASC